MVASAFLFAAMAALIKAAGRSVPPAQVVFVRNVVHALLFVPLWWFLTDRRLAHPRLLALRGLLGLLAVEAYAWTLTLLDLADAWMLQAMNGVFVALLAPRLLGERARGPVALALVVSLAGAALIVRPGLRVELVPGIVGVLGALCSALAYLTVRRLGRHEHPLAVVMAFPLVAGPLSLPMALMDWRWPDALGWAAMVGAALCAAGGQLFLTVGLKATHAARATTATYIGFVFAAVLGWACFAEPPAWTTVAGAALILAGLALLTRPDRRPLPASAEPPAGAE
jgi:drug/metabolite transporter (DMT)-like permease